MTKMRDRARARVNQLNQVRAQKEQAKAMRLPVSRAEFARALAGPIAQIEGLGLQATINQYTMLKLLKNKGLITDEDVEQANAEVQAEYEEARAKAAEERAKLIGASGEALTEPAPTGDEVAQDTTEETVPRRARLVEG